ncbi:MAG TPA: DUF1329 domain-containing protein [Candidatus Binatia bacterium]|nr:DUF1329 domain-containing protein [Candidatus Binatia bacterium]
MSALIRILATVAVLGLVAAAPARAGSEQPGGWLDQSTSSQARDLLPTEFLGRYQRGEWKHEIVTPRPDVLLVDPEWVAAGKENEGKFRLDENGSIRRADNGEEPTWIYGTPFPTIDPKDPQAATKMVWNYYYNYWTLGNNLTNVRLIWVSHAGADREAANTVYQKFWDGQKPHRTPRENPMNLLYQQFVSTDAPADLQGINTLNWRYRDTRRDSTWSYVPALRRVRQVTPTNRADGFLGSDMSQDDGGYFDPKPEDFTFKLIGEGEQLFAFDRAAALENADDLQRLPGGGWRVAYAPTPRFNFQKPGFDATKDLAWAPVSDRTVLVRRPVWIVEATPKDRFYIYGKILLRFDKEDFTGFGSYTSKYDWQGTLLNSYLSGGRGGWHKKDGDSRQYSAQQFTMAQNWRLDRATVSAAQTTDTLIDFPERQFETEVISHGK